MKKLSKTLLAVAAVSAVSAAMAASAMAMDARYVDPETDPAGVGYVELTNVAANGKSQTLLIYKSEDGEGTFNTVDYTTDDIEGINQEDGDNTTPGSVQGNIPVGDLAEGTYQVRVAGSEGTMQFASFKVTSGGGGDEDVKTITIGDIDGAYGVDGDDVTNLARWLVDVYNSANEDVETTYTVTESNIEGLSSITIGDIDGAYGVDGDDVTNLARWLVDVYNSANENVGKTVTVSVTPITEE